MDEMKQAIDLMQQEKYEQAAELFTEIIEKNPNEPLGYINFGNLLLHMNDHERAERFFRRALELDDKVATGYYGLGNLFFEQEKYAEAQSNFQQAVKLGLDEADVYFMLALTFQNQDHHKLALPYFQRAVELSSLEDPAILFQYGLTLAQTNQIDEAQQKFQQVLKIDENHSDAHYNVGVTYLYQENVNQALKHFNLALDIQPDHLLANNGKKMIMQMGD